MTGLIRHKMLSKLLVNAFEYFRLLFTSMKKGLDIRNNTLPTSNFRMMKPYIAGRIYVVKTIWGFG